MLLLIQGNVLLAKFYSCTFFGSSANIQQWASPFTAGVSWLSRPDQLTRLQTTSTWDGFQQAECSNREVYVERTNICRHQFVQRWEWNLCVFSLRTPSASVLCYLTGFLSETWACPHWKCPWLCHQPVDNNNCYFKVGAFMRHGVERWTTIYRRVLQLCIQHWLLARRRSI